MKRQIALFSLLLITACAGQDVTLQGLTDGNFRFKDIGGQAFSQSFISSYSYAAANVTFSFDTNDNDYLSGTISASGLKPNFAYQIKLAGNPSSEAVTDDEKAAADDATNERLGFIGRWWRAQPSPANTNDADYNINKATAGYIYDGYLLIGFFVTDSSGNANLHFDGFNSFHVVWRVDQRPHPSSDGPVLPVSVPDTTGNPAYDAAVAARDFSLYGEHEPTRAAPGQLVMPHEHYRCRLQLAEESFHDNGALAGSWTTAMSAPFEFNIPTSASVPGTGGNPPPSTLPLQVSHLKANLNFRHGGHDRAQIMGSFTVPAGFNAANLEVQASVFNAAQKYSLNAKGRDVVSSGMFSLVAPPAGSTLATFQLRMHNANFGVTPGVLTALPITVLTLKISGDTYSGSISPKTKISGQKVSLMLTTK